MPADGEAEAAGWVFNVQRFSVHDGPGIRTTVFLKGCPLRCIWCDNPESQRMEPQVVYWADRCIHCGACLEACGRQALLGAVDGEKTIVPDDCDLCGRCASECYSGALEIIGKRQTASEVVSLVIEDRAFYDQSGGGVTLSGGEPTMQPGFAAAILAGCREHGIHTAIETSGFAPWPAWERLIPHLDLILYDLKEVDSSRHKALTGVPSDLILANFRRLVERGVPLIVRRPVIPGCNDSAASMEALAQFLAETAPGIEINLLPYHRFGRGKYDRLGLPYEMGDRPSLDDEDLVGWRDTFNQLGFVARIGG